MKILRSFLMEDQLENHRFDAAYNMGESGARHRTVLELVTGAGLSPEEASAAFLGLSLRDSPNWGRADLRDAVAALHPGAARENVLITTGTSEALLLLFRQLAPRKVALAVPAFQLLYEIPMALDAAIVGLPVEWDDAGKPFVDAARWGSVLAAQKPDVVILNNPHNPSGLILSAAAVGTVRAYVDSSGGRLVCDEHYRFLSSDVDVLGPTNFRPDGRTWVTGSFTKCLGTPGLRVGWCVGPHATLAEMQSEKNYTTHTVNPVSEWLAITLLMNLNAPAFQSARAEWKANRRTLADALAKSGELVGWSPEGGLVTSIGFRSVRTREAFLVLQKRLLAAGVFCLPLESMEFGTVFGGDGTSPLAQGHGVRLGLGVEPATFARGVAVIERVATGGA